MKTLEAVGTVVLIVLTFAAVFALDWAISSATIALFLNAVGGFGLSFAQVIGLGGILSVATIKPSSD